MTRDEVIEALDGRIMDPDNPRFCDALCDAAEFLGLPEGQYDYEYLRAQVEAA